MSNHHPNGSGNPSSGSDDGDGLSNLMMASIPRRSLPPKPSPTGADPLAPDTTSLENMTIPRRKLTKKPSADRSSNGSLQRQREGSFPRRLSDGSDRGGTLSSSARPSRPKPKHVTIQSEYPFIIKIKTRGVPLDPDGIPRFRASTTAAKTTLLATSTVDSSTRTPKRARPFYKEQDTDDDDDLIDSDDEAYNARPKKLRKGASQGKTHDEKTANSSTGAVGAGHAASSFATSETSGVPMDPAPAPASSGEMVLVSQDGTPLIDSPPPGFLHTLWYSREVFLHIFVVDKIVGWKRRHVVSLEWDDPDALKFLDPTEASSIQQKTLSHPDFWNDHRKRMEVSRINVTQCPVVMTIAAEREKARALEENRKPKYTLNVSADNREDVLLVKWRGRSHMHCSWERASDIIKLDQSNSTARHKIRRYYQSQEMTLGKDWKKILEEDRATAAAIHSHGETANADVANDQADEGEEFFPSQFIEVERILTCDEHEMDMQVLAKQRALNIRAEQEALEIREEAETRTDADALQKQKSNSFLLKDLVDVRKPEDPWDPEDNVRYVVKWKGLPFAEMTWEYWRDIKRDAVEEAEDFWYRQKPPSPDEVKRLLSKPHPHVKDFRKITESKAYGVSSKPRPVADLGDGAVIPEEDENENKKGGFQLRSYQLEGVNWLLFNWWNKRSCILADEMGLGKTIQTICFLRELQTNPSTEVRGPTLIVAPLSLIGQWKSEAALWAPDFNVVLYHGSADAREWLVNHEFYFSEEHVGKGTANHLRRNHVTKFHILITTFEVILKDIHVVSKIKWKTLIVDEAHRLKNPSARLFAELASVPRDYCVLLTGTPLANNTEELWALLHFDDPKTFQDKDDFMEKFGQMSDSSQVSELHTLLKPYLLRRVKEDVEKSLPPKEETILEVTLTPIQKKYYKAIYERNTAFLYKGATRNNAPSLMNAAMELRKICNHPFLLRGLEENILSEAFAKAKEESGDGQVDDYAKLFAEQLVKSSGKMVLMEKLLLKLFNNGHKVLIFSQMVRALDLLEELLKIKRYRYERLDGSTSSSSRAAAVDRFNRKSCQRFVMLLSTRAGGLGLNLTSADIVVIFDSDWNPQNDLQAMARAHRIGQTRKVQIFRLLTAKTYEMHMFHSASMKLGLERAVLAQQRDQGDDMDENSQKKAKSDREAHAKEIDELLKKGAYDIFRDEDDEEAKKFMERDIDHLLEHSSKTVTYGASSESLGNGLGSFSKASFVTDTGDGEKDVDLDDPDFWAKAVGLEAPVETPEEVAQMLDDGVKRSRKQVQQFDPYAEAREAERLKQLKIEMQLQAEKEEKERLRLEKKKRKKEAKEKRRKERENEEKKKASLEKDKGASSSSSKKKKKEGEAPTKAPELAKKVVKEVVKVKKSKKSDRRRALRRAANEDPIIERLKQGWEVPQRNRATAAALRFGFGRYNKMRHESNLTSLPLQDLENFVRSYTYQITLQVAVSFLSELHKSSSTEERDFRSLLKEWMGPGSESELDWLCNSIYSAMRLQFEVQSCRRFLRMPLILAEPTYVAELRQGAAFRALRRIGILARLNRVIEEALDSVLSGLGHEELAKRGCGTSDLSTLDSDLRARHVSAEELSLAAGVQYRKPVNLQAPATWWDRNCDIALLIGAFVHGLGNYEAMRNDEDLPFAHHMRVYAESDEASCAANRAFQAAAFAAKVVFEEALERAKAKAAYEVQAAVAAAAATASEREQDAVALRLGGAAADAVLSNLPDLPEEPMATKRSTVDDLHFITLPRLQEAIIKYARKDYHEVVARPVTTEVVPVSVESENGKVKSENGTVKSGESKEVTSAVVSEEAVVAEDNLPMPDSRVLNRRFIEILNEVEANLDNQKTEYDISEAGNRWEANQYVLTNREIRSKALSSLFVSEDDLKNVLSEYSGVGISGAQCGSTHRSLDDGSDFSVGSASPDLGQIAHGTDAPRYLRALGVPMNVTRFAITALVYADSSTVLQMLENERLRNNMRDKSKEKSPKRGKAPNKLTADQTPSKTPNSSFAGDESNVVNGTKPKKETDAKVDFPPSDKNGSAHEIIEQAKVKSSADPTEKNTKLELVSTSKEIKREPASMIENEPNPPRTATENDTKSPSQLIEDTKNQEAKLASNWLEEKEAIKLRSHAVEENPPTNSNVEAAKTPSDSVDGSKEVPNSVENDVKPKSIPDSVPEKSLSDSVKTEDNLTFDKLSNPVGGGEPNVKSDPGDVPMSDATEADAKIESNSGDVPMPDAVEGDVKIESDPGDVPITDAVERGPKPDQADLLQPDTVETYVKPKSEQTLPNDTDDKSESAEKDRKTTPLDSAKQVVSEYTDATLPQESENTTKSPQSTADKRDEKDGKSSSKSTDKKHDPSSSKANAGTDSPVAPSPKDPAELVLSPFKDNARLRAAVSSTVLLYGYPSLKTSTSTSSVAKSLWISVREQGGALDEKEPASLFNMKTFVNRIQSFIPGEPLPDTQAIQDYVEKTLLPHCLRLSIFGNGPCTRNARGSKGKYETALGISHYPEPSKEVQSPLPDPCLPLGEQSLEAVAYSCAILRRVRLMRAAQHVATGNISVEDLEQVARSSFMCKNLDGLPLWWCPWVHDVALLVHASTNGLFSIVQNHHNDLSAGVFSRKAIVHTMYSTFFADEKMLPKTIVDQFEQDDANEWIKLHAKDFPTANVLERRLAFLCSQATKSDEGELRYDNLPMFDHGGWPRA